ncbi:hypothetical protein EPUS_00907 [Endocarpon pusillum Z07020]|uniref:C2H2-type domain-containing protein n=1 Tax=Endocarpon pusillum (strain Z07020 / HMAS-L-300199) TaxID=1263415 RepID=U1HWA4_ENDPU|nr:uncharacterized protein EPUS_00907 [Endocarpon pusillum Z07020]ERF73654.1 hypothetical protein EPUS_00907 [Endocarpon pusillum Z07020]
MESANSIILTDKNTSSSQGADSESSCNQSYQVRTSAWEQQPKMISTASAATAGLHATTPSNIPVRQFRAGVTGAGSARALMLDKELSLTRVQDSGGPMPMPTPMHELHDPELSAHFPLLTDNWQLPPDHPIPPVQPVLFSDSLIDVLSPALGFLSPSTSSPVPADHSYISCPADDLHSYSLEQYIQITGEAEFLNAITAADAAMPYGLDDLILPSTLPETNIDLDFDTMLAAVSPVHHHDLSLSSSVRSHSPSGTTSSTYSLSQDVDLDIDMAFQGDQEAAQRLLFPSSNQSYYSQPQAMASQQLLYTSQPAPPPNNQSWMSLPVFAQQPNSYNNTLPPNTIYPSFDSNGFSTEGGVIPPTPQATEAPSFFLPSQPQEGMLTAGPSHTTSYNSSHESNTASISSSISRSCSPVSLNCTASVTTFQSTAPAYARRLSSTPQPASSVTQSQSSNSLFAYGIPVPQASPNATQTWRCAYPNCSSRALFTRGCDLRKHYNRHSKHLFCRIKGCPQSGPRVAEGGNNNANGASIAGFGGVGMGGGFSSKKDRARHEAKHNPRILCEWVGEGGERCGRRFSRVDNMKDHVRRIHRRGQADGQHESGIGVRMEEAGAANAATA